jgi:(S)-2-hydroxyglutarate dehydrogenase
MFRFAVIGAGIIGLATAAEIQRRHPDSRVTVLEKEGEVAGHQTSHNSGVVHAGVYYPPGSLKAQLCTRGRALLKDYCEQNGIRYEECGKVVVARDSREVPLLREIEHRAIENSVPDTRWLDSSALAEVEPHARGVAALHSPRTAIVDFAQVARVLARDIDVRLGFEVTEVRTTPTEVVFSGPAGEVEADRAVICAGLQTDRIAKLAGDLDGPAIIPFRGEYWRLSPDAEHLVRGLIYPVPDPAYPFLGVHLTRRVGGGVDVGPNAVLALSREGYRRRDVSLKDMADALRYPGFKPMARRNWRAGLSELRSSFSRQVFANQARRLVPELDNADLIRAPAGVRAQAVDPDGSLVDDFRIGRAGERGEIIMVRNAPSPAATSSLAIAELIAGDLEHTFG